MRRKIKIFASIIILLSIIFSPLQTAAADSWQKLLAYEGRADLSSVDLRDMGRVNLDGEWEFYWDQFLTPDDFNAGNNFNGMRIKMPGLWSQFSEENSSIKQTGRATFRLVVNMNRKYDTLSLFVPVLGSAYRIWIDGKLVGSIGEMDASGRVIKPSLINNQIFFSPKSEQIEIVINAANIEPIYAGTTKSIELGIPEKANSISYHSVSVDMFLFGSVIIIAIYHLVLYMLRRKDTSNLYFSLLCFCAGFRSIFYNRVVSDILFSNISWNIVMKLYCIFTVGACITLLLYLYVIFTEESNFKILRIFLLLTSVTATFTALLPIKFIGIISMSSNVMFGLSLIYIFVVLVKALKNKREGSLPIFLAGLISVASTLLDLMYSYHIIKYSRFTSVGIFIFIMVQAFVLSRKFLNAYYRAEKLAVENKLYYEEIKSLNLELEEKVKERTKELEVEVKEHKQAREEVVRAYNEIDLLSKTDYLTKLSNRRDIHEKLNLFMKDVERNSIFFAVVLCDIDDFKKVNDVYGHDMGDYILIEAADIMIKSVREGDLVGRWGGEEFALVLPCRSIKESQAVVENVRGQINRHTFEFNDEKLRITITFGMCIYDGTADIDKCISFADQALYQGKRSGKNKVVVYDC
jgi:diguanylate cyclase (GGDEF)-like protein